MEIGPLFAHFSDFLNYCHFTSHDTQTLGYMRDSLHRFKLECERHFMRFHPTKLSTPKYHLLEHYTSFVERFGSLLNGDTDTTEGIHTMIKAAYRKTNKKGTWIAQYFLSNCNTL